MLEPVWKTDIVLQENTPAPRKSDKEPYPHFSILFSTIFVYELLCSSFYVFDWNFNSPLLDFHSNHQSIMLFFEQEGLLLLVFFALLAILAFLTGKKVFSFIKSWPVPPFLNWWSADTTKNEVLPEIDTSSVLLLLCILFLLFVLVSAVAYSIDWNLQRSLPSLSMLIAFALLLLLLCFWPTMRRFVIFLRIAMRRKQRKIVTVLAELHKRETSAPPPQKLSSSASPAGIVNSSTTTSDAPTTTQKQ